MFEEYQFISGVPSTWPEITKHTTFEELKFIHQKIWDYAIDHRKKPQTPYFSNCVACEYINMHEVACDHCPIIWPKTPHCSAEDGLFRKWLLDRSFENATAIRDVKWRGDKDA